MKTMTFVAACVAAWLAVPAAFAGEHPGSGTEHPGSAADVKGRKFTAKEIKAAMIAHIKAAGKANKGLLIVHDDVEKADRSLKFVKLHDPVRVIDGKTAFACADFTEMVNGKKSKNTPKKPPKTRRKRRKRRGMT